jgi:hypothetical protein
MTCPVTTLVRVRVGCCGPVSPEDGVLVRLPADLAAELVRVGDAVRVPLVDEDEPDPTPQQIRSPANGFNERT